MGGLKVANITRSGPTNSRIILHTVLLPFSTSEATALHLAGRSLSSSYMSEGEFSLFQLSQLFRHFELRSHFCTLPFGSQCGALLDTGW